MVSTNIGVIPEEDYLEIKARQYGFDSYADLRKEGYTIELPVSADVTDNPHLNE